MVHDESDYIDELDYRSRKLTNLLRKNVNIAEKRKSLLDIVREKAWLLEDQAKLLNRQTELRSAGCSRLLTKIILFLSLIASSVFVVNHFFGDHLKSG